MKYDWYALKRTSTSNVYVFNNVNVQEACTLIGDCHWDVAFSQVSLNQGHDKIKRVKPCLEQMGIPRDQGYLAYTVPLTCFTLGIP